MKERMMIRRKQVIKCKNCGGFNAVRFNSKPPAPRWVVCDHCKKKFIAYPMVGSKWEKTIENAWWLK